MCCMSKVPSTTYGSICPCEACEEELMLLVGFWLQKITINWVSQWPVTNNSLIEGILASKMHPSLDTHSCGHQTGKCCLHLWNLAWDMWLLPCRFLLIIFLKTIWNITIIYSNRSASKSLSCIVEAIVNLFSWKCFIF